MIEIPLNSSPEQLFSINIDGAIYNFRVYVNSRTRNWGMNIATNEGIRLVDGVLLLPGVELLGQYNLPIRNMYLVNLDNPFVDPTPSDLGTAAHLFVLTDTEVPSGSTV